MADTQIDRSPSNRLISAHSETDQTIRLHLQRTAIVLENTGSMCITAIAQAAQTIADSFREGGKLLLCGNGGSAAECQHMAAELTHRLSAAVIRPALPALALTTDTSFLTACSNDDGFEIVFARQIEALGNPGDVLLGISTSGNSPNVAAAFQQARLQGLHLIALTGMQGALIPLADVAITIPSSDTQAIQETHLAVIHILCGIIERIV